jgi:peroxiredoxin
MTRVRTDRLSETTIVRSRSKLLVRALVVLFVAAILAQFARMAFGRDLVGSEAPDFALKSAAGTNVRLSEYRSEVVAVTFWASWCGACRDSLTALEKLQTDMGARGLRVLGVSFDKQMPVAREAAQAARVTYPVLLDAAGDVGRLYDVGKLPMVVLVDRGGRIRGSYEGGRSASVQALAGEIGALLRE